SAILIRLLRHYHLHEMLGRCRSNCRECTEDFFLTQRYGIEDFVDARDYVLICLVLPPRLHRVAVSSPTCRIGRVEVGYPDIVGNPGSLLAAQLLCHTSSVSCCHCIEISRETDTIGCQRNTCVSSGKVTNGTNLRQ